ncbi:MAG TPA: VOC family protein [Pyrinomonadaceae bacterium]|jgi:lactoylglutathione lyase
MLKQLDYAMVVVSDMARAVAFYRDKLGLKLRFETPDWTEFETGTTTIALHGGGSAQPAAAPHEGAADENQRAGTCALGFTVENLAETYAELTGRGVVFAMPPTVREAERIKLAVALDPDGLSISFAEPLR